LFQSCYYRILINSFQGLTDYSDEIGSFWPEFARNGKGSVRIVDVLRHESGLADFFSSGPEECLNRENIKKNEVGRVVEAQSLKFPPEEGLTYDRKNVFYCVMQVVGIDDCWGRGRNGRKCP
jgi:hypothetical protein